MRLIDADALDLDREVELADDWKTAHEIANVVKYAPTVDAVPLDKLCEWLEENAGLPTDDYMISKTAWKRKLKQWMEEQHEKEKQKE